MRPLKSTFASRCGGDGRCRWPTVLVVSLALFAGGFTEVAQAQQAGTITGRVTNSSTNEPLSAAQVSLPD
ncbi:MAG: hypothetical protein Q8N53_22285, partial [Longimicrobiales bacterium]|nr:hypothetical protein [Longimicrobiales bacterium]